MSTITSNWALAIQLNFWRKVPKEHWWQILRFMAWEKVPEIVPANF